MYTIKTIFNNNIILASTPDDNEVIFIGKGIGFNKKSGSVITEKQAEKVFVLKDEKDKKEYLDLMKYVSVELVSLMSDIMTIIYDEFDNDINDRIHITLTDHLSFTLKRLKLGYTVNGFFLEESKFLFEREYKTAEKVTKLIEDKLNITLPPEEVSFITMHIYSAREKITVTSAKRQAETIVDIINYIEFEMKRKLDYKNIFCVRFIRHLQFKLQRITNDEIIHDDICFSEMVKDKYKKSYEISMKVVKIIERRMGKELSEAEGICIALHLQLLLTH